MQLTKNQVEAVRYQLKKLDMTASNEDIRLASDNFEQFDALAIADLIVKNRTENIDKVDKEVSEYRLRVMLSGCIAFPFIWFFIIFRLYAHPTVEQPRITSQQQNHIQSIGHWTNKF